MLTWRYSWLSAALYHQAVMATRSNEGSNPPRIPTSLQSCLPADGEVSERRLMAAAASCDTASVESEPMLRALCNDINMSLSTASIALLLHDLTQLATDFAVAEPSLMHELAVRSGPLQMQWEAFGPGLLQAFRSITHQAWDAMTIATRITLVPPWRHGFALKVNEQDVLFEALLTNVDDLVPEVLRLAWACVQPVATHGSKECSWYLLPPLLVAASKVDLAEMKLETLRRAIELWGRVDERGSAANAQLADALYAWWTKMEKEGRPWHEAVNVWVVNSSNRRKQK